MHVYLKVKAASLAAEARIIRKLEQKTRAYLRRTPNWPDDPKLLENGAAVAFWGLRNHRTNEVRREARATCLAIGFLRGRPYKTLEAKCYTPPDWKRVQTLIEKYGEGDKRDLVQRFAEWKDAS